MDLAGRKVPDPLPVTAATQVLVAQEQTDAKPKNPGSGLIDYLLNYLNLAGTKSRTNFCP